MAVDKSKAKQSYLHTKTKYGDGTVSSISDSHRVLEELSGQNREIGELKTDFNRVREDIKEVKADFKTVIKMMNEYDNEVKAELKTVHKEISDVKKEVSDGKSFLKGAFFVIAIVLTPFFINQVIPFFTKLLD